MVQPVELQDNLSKAPLAAREQHLQQTRPDLAQQAITQEAAQEYILDHSRTRPTEQKHPAQMQVYDHGRRGGERERRERRRGEEPAEPSKAPAEKVPPSPEEGVHHVDFIA